jgi:hypothetical protein
MAIAFDTSTDGGLSVAVTSKTFSHTCTGTNLALIVSFFGEASDNVTGVTYNGVAMTRMGFIDPGGGDRFEFMYGLLNPATGANNVVISFSSSSATYAQSSSYTGVKQTGLPDNVTTQANASASSSTTTLTPVASGCWLVMGSRTGGITVTAGAGTTMRQTTAANGQNLCDSNGTVSGSSSLVQNYSPSSTSGCVMISMAPVSAPVSSIISRRMLMGVGM